MNEFTFNKTLTDPQEISSYLLKLRNEKSKFRNKAVTYYSLEWLVTWDGERYNVYKCKTASFGKLIIPLQELTQTNNKK